MSTKDCCWPASASCRLLQFLPPFFWSVGATCCTQYVITPWLAFFFWIQLASFFPPFPPRGIIRERLKLFPSLSSAKTIARNRSGGRGRRKRFWAETREQWPYRPAAKWAVWGKENSSNIYQIFLHQLNTIHKKFLWLKNIIHCPDGFAAGKKLCILGRLSLQMSAADTYNALPNSFFSERFFSLSRTFQCQKLRLLLAHEEAHRSWRLPQVRWNHLKKLSSGHWWWCQLSTVQKHIRETWRLTSIFYYSQY